MFAAGLFFERDPLKLADLPQAIQVFIVNAGLFTAIALAVWLILSRLTGQKRTLGDTAGWVKVGFRLAIVLGCIAYLVKGAMLLLESTAAGTGPHRRTIYRIDELSQTIGGACALL